MRRRVVVAVPARNEAEAIGACLSSLLTMTPDPRATSVEVVVLANNCTDDTARVAAAFGPAVRAVAMELPPERAHAGWARRLALDAAANRLRKGGDLLLSTDADTRVAPDWLSRTLDHVDAGWDAVAGLARLDPAELRSMRPAHRRRLAMIQRHESALTFLKARADASEPRSRHFYEGGASIALTLDAYRRTGGAPTPEVGEDKALFDAVRRVGGRVRHPTDVRVMTSARLVGRAPGGASDTLSLWGRQDDDQPIWGLTSMNGGPLTFRGLESETRAARARVAAARVTADATNPDDKSPFALAAG